METNISSFSEYESHYKKAKENPKNYWATFAEQFTWKKKWDSIQTGNFKDLDVKWFEGGQLNITENCLDRHLKQKGEKLALIYEPNNHLQC